MSEADRCVWCNAVLTLEAGDLCSDCESEREFEAVLDDAFKKEG